MGGMRYNDKTPSRTELKAHLEDGDIHGRKGASSMLALPENHTYRGNASGKAATTDVLEIYTTGAKITTDHPLTLTGYLVNVVPLEIGEDEPDASGYLIGTFLAIHEV